jgi:hypothetical protein
MEALILSDVNDLLALRVAARLRSSAAGVQVRLVSLAELELSPAWQVHLDDSTRASSVRLHDGSTLSSDGPDVVFNRLQHVRMEHYAAAKPADREYALMEMFALMVSWLTSLPCPVLDRAAPDGLGGRPRSPIGWQILAGRAGLSPMRLLATTSLRRYRVPGWKELDPRLLLPGMEPVPVVAHLDHPAVLAAPIGNETCSGVVVGNEVLGNLPAELVAPCLRLARLAGTTLLRCHFTRDGAGATWLFTGADPWLAEGDPAVADAVAQALVARGRGGAGPWEGR